MIKNQRELLSDIIWSSNKLLIQKTRQCGCTTLLVNNVLDMLHQKEQIAIFGVPNKGMVDEILKKVQERSDTMSYGVDVKVSKQSCSLPNGSKLEVFCEADKYCCRLGLPDFVVIDEVLLFKDLNKLLKHLLIDINRDDTKVILAATPSEIGNNKEYVELFKETDKQPLNTKWRLFKLKWFALGCNVNFFKKVNDEYIVLSTQRPPFEAVIKLICDGWFPSFTDVPTHIYSEKQYVNQVLGEFCE